MVLLCVYVCCLYITPILVHIWFRVQRHGYFYRTSKNNIEIETNDDNVAGSFSCYVLIKYTRNTALNEKIKTFFFISSFLRTHTLCCKLCHYEIENGPNVIIPIKLRSFCFQFYSFIRLQYIQHKNVFAQLTKCLPIRAYTFWIACLFVRRLMVLRSFSFKYSIYQTQNWSYHHFQPKTKKRIL